MKPIPTISIIALLAALTGCGTVNTVSTRTTPSQDSVEYRRQINDLFTEIFLHARDVRLSRTKGGVLEAQVDVANDSRSTRGFSYRFAWLNERGSVIESPMSVWKAARVPAGGSIMISSVALGSCGFNSGSSPGTRRRWHMTLDSRS